MICYTWQTHVGHIISGNVAYKKVAQQGMGRWGRAFPAWNAVDGNTDPNMWHRHCAWAQSKGKYGYSWVVDLTDLYEIEKITLYATSGE